MSERDGHLDQLFQILVGYADRAIEEFDERCRSWPLDPNQNEVHEVVGGLLSRQTTLAVEIAHGPPMWTPHIAPLLLRPMVDLRITFAWILQEPVTRSRQFVRYGLGQVKLSMEHLKAKLAATGGDPESNAQVKMLQQWIDGQRFHFLTEVNVGNWAEKDLRTMATDCGCETLYREDFQNWSSATHSMWHHIQPFSLEPCRNPLHRGGHRVPRASLPFPPDLDYPRAAAHYLDDTFEVFDTFRGEKPNCASALEWFESELAKLGDRIKVRPTTPEDPPMVSNKSPSIVDSVRNSNQES